MCLPRNRHYPSTIFLIIFSSVKQRSSIILFARVCVRNMCIHHPRHWRTLKNIISKWPRKISFLFISNHLCPDTVCIALSHEFSSITLYKFAIHPSSQLPVFLTLQAVIYLFQLKERIFIVLYIVPYIFTPFLNNGVSLCF
mgnify:CR=1 FL=1